MSWSKFLTVYRTTCFRPQLSLVPQVVVDRLSLTSHAVYLSASFKNSSELEPSPLASNHTCLLASLDKYLWSNRLDKLSWTQSLGQIQVQLGKLLHQLLSNHSQIKPHWSRNWQEARVEGHTTICLQAHPHSEACCWNPGRPRSPRTWAQLSL